MYQQLEIQNVELRTLRDWLQKAEAAIPTPQADCSKDLSNIDKVHTIMSIKCTYKLTDFQAPLQLELDSIKRENRLIATAFYDLAGRIQMGNVTVQRRNEVSKGFLNRHRQQVYQATAARSR